MHKISDVLPAWLIWRGDDRWLVQLTIRSDAKETRAEGEFDGRLKLFVKAPPIEGRVNQAIVQSIASSVGVPASHVNLVSGLKSKKKSVTIETPKETAIQLIEQPASIGHYSTMRS
jgi:uncharacterized protein (TIGR00251 family)